MPEFSCKCVIEIEVIIKAKNRKHVFQELDDLGVSVSLEDDGIDILDWTVSSDHNEIDWEVSKSEPIE